MIKFLKVFGRNRKKNMIDIRESIMNAKSSYCIWSNVDPFISLFPSQYDKDQLIIESTIEIKSEILAQNARDIVHVLDFWRNWK